MSRIDKYHAPQTKIYGGKRYTITTFRGTKSEAEDAANWQRKRGKLARVVEIPKAPKGKGGFTTKVYAIYTRSK